LATADPPYPAFLERGQELWTITSTASIEGEAKTPS
jgi:hypothetical protein